MILIIEHGTNYKWKWHFVKVILQFGALRLQSWVEWDWGILRIQIVQAWASLCSRRSFPKTKPKLDVASTPNPTSVPFSKWNRFHLQNLQICQWGKYSARCRNRVGIQITVNGCHPNKTHEIVNIERQIISKLKNKCYLDRGRFKDDTSLKNNLTKLSVNNTKMFRRPAT